MRTPTQSQLDSPRRMSASVKLLHISALGLYLYVTYFLQFENVQNTKQSTNPTIKVMSGFSKRFLTNWTYGVQTIYLAICVLAHFLNIFKAFQNGARKLFSVADYLFTSIATPMAFLVSLVFWILYMIDRELVYPKALDAVIPVYINHCIHTFNSIIAIVDMSLINHKFSSWSTSLKGTIAYLLAYAVCLFGTYFETGVWLYPILKELDWPQRIAFAIGNLVVAALMFALTKLVHWTFWGSAAPVSEKTKKGGKHKKK